MANVDDTTRLAQRIYDMVKVSLLEEGVVLHVPMFVNVFSMSQEQLDSGFVQVSAAFDANGVWIAHVINVDKSVLGYKDELPSFVSMIVGSIKELPSE